MCSTQMMRRTETKSAPRHRRASNEKSPRRAPLPHPPNPLGACVVRRPASMGRRRRRRRRSLRRRFLRMLRRNRLTRITSGLCSMWRVQGVGRGMVREVCVRGGFFVNYRSVSVSVSMCVYVCVGVCVCVLPVPLVSIRRLLPRSPSSSTPDHKPKPYAANPKPFPHSPCHSVHEGCGRCL